MLRGEAEEAGYRVPLGQPIAHLRRVIAALPKSYRAIAIDHRGWGESDESARGYGLADLADDAQGALEALAYPLWPFDGRQGRGWLLKLIRALPDTLKYENQLIIAEGDYVIAHAWSGLVCLRTQ